MVEIMDAVLETLIDDGALEICKRRFEGRVVVVVDGDGLAWIDQFDDFHSLTGIHVESVSADVEPYQHVSCGVLKFEHVAHDLWQERRKATRCMPTRHGADTECAISSLKVERLPCFEGMGNLKAHFAQSLSSFGSSDNGNSLLEIACYQAVKVVLVQV